MAEIEIKTVPEEDYGARKQPSALLFLLLSGVCGSLLLFSTLEGVSFSPWYVYPEAVLLCLLTWYLAGRGRKAAAGWLFLLCLGFLGAVWRMWDTLGKQMSYLVASIAGRNETLIMPVTQTAALLAAALVILWFLLVFVMKSQAILYLLITDLLLVAVLYGIRIPVTAVILIFLFQLFFWMVFASEKEGSVLLDSKRQRVSGKSSFLIGFLATVFFGITLFVVFRWHQSFYNFFYEVEGYAYRTFSHLSGRDVEPSVGGVVSRGNNYRTGTVQLEIRSKKQPTEVLYLCGFEGGEYIGGNWESADDEELFDRIEYRLDWKEWSYMIGSMYYSMFYVMNDRAVREEEPPEPNVLLIWHSNRNYDRIYIPYYSQRNHTGEFAREVRERQGEGYVYNYYEQKDMDADWSRLSSDWEQIREWYEMIQDAYLEEARISYTRVPMEQLPRLARLVEENPLKTPEEITSFILYTLHSNAEYTLTPGWAPLQEDIVEYFLFQGGRGYCVHFAAAATLMYRMYGIPARYATGYMVAPSDFVLQEDGTWLAEVTDEKAHAWVEIFLRGYGWTPVEVTPASDGSTVASYPGFDGGVFAEVMRQKGWNRNVPSLKTAGTKQEGQTEVFVSPFSFSFAPEKYEGVCLLAAIGAVYVLLLFPFFLDYRRKESLGKMNRLGCRKVFARLLGMLHFGGYLLEYSGAQEEFSEEASGEFAMDFSRQIPVVSQQEVACMLEFVRKAAYGPQEDMQDADAFVREIYRRAAGFVEGKMTWGKRMVFRYFKNYG